MIRWRNLPLLVVAFILLGLVACGPSGAAGTLQENGATLSPALATWDYATVTSTPLPVETVAPNATVTRTPNGSMDSSDGPESGDGTAAGPTLAPYPEPWWTATARPEQQATTEILLATNTSVAATVAAGGSTPTPDLTRWAEETRAAPSPTVTATPTPYCEPREAQPVTASLRARLEAAVAEAHIPGLQGSDVVALDRLCYGYAEGEETPGGSTWFYVGISVPGYDVGQVLDSFAAYLQLLMDSFAPDDLYGEDGLIYGSLTTVETGAAGEPLRWSRSVSLEEAEVRSLYAQGLRGRELARALGYDE